MGVSRTAVWKAWRPCVTKAIASREFPIGDIACLLPLFSIQKNVWNPCCHPGNSICLIQSIQPTGMQSLWNPRKPWCLRVIRARGGEGSQGVFTAHREACISSLLFPATFPLSDASLITSAAAVAVSEAIEEKCGKYCRING